MDPVTLSLLVPKVFDRVITKTIRTTKRHDSCESILIYASWWDSTISSRVTRHHPLPII